MFTAIEKTGDLIPSIALIKFYYLYFALIGMDQFKQVFSMSILFYAIAKLRSHNDAQFFLLTTIAGAFSIRQVLSDMLFIFSGLRAKRNPFLKRSCSSAFWLPHSTQMLFSRNSPNCSEREHTRCIFRVGSMTGRKERKTSVWIRSRYRSVHLPVFLSQGFSRRIKWMLTLSLFGHHAPKALGYEAEFLHRVYYDPALAIILAYPAVWAGLPANRKPIFLVGSR